MEPKPETFTYATGMIFNRAFTNAFHAIFSTILFAFFIDSDTSENSYSSNSRFRLIFVILSRFWVGVWTNSGERFN